MTTTTHPGLMVRNPDGSERACTRHNQLPYEAELLKRGKRFNRVMLRCTVCDRPQGERLVLGEPS